MSRYFLIILLFAIAGCKKKDPPVVHHNVQNDGVFIVNEGNYQWSNASLSYYDFKTDSVMNNVFAEVNQTPLGDVAQSIAIIDSLGYVVVNNSAFIYVINIYSFKFVAKITGFVSPRYIQVVSKTKAYVSDLYDHSITIINPQTYENLGKINIGHTTEKFIKKEKFVFVTCWNFDNKILVIDSDNNQVTDSLTVGKQPNSIVMDKNEKFWVLCDGGFAGSPYGQEKASLVKINPSNLQVESTLQFENINDSPIELNLNKTKDTLYFINNDLYRMGISDTLIPQTSFVQHGEHYFYGLAIDVKTNNIFIADAVDYVNQGIVLIYNPAGEQIRKLNAGILPAEFCFNY